MHLIAITFNAFLKDSLFILGGAIPPPGDNWGAPVPLVAEAAGTWNHEGRDYWPTQFAACNGKRQSPININNQDVKLETDVNDLNFPRYSEVRAQILLTKFYSFARSINFKECT